MRAMRRHDKPRRLRRWRLLAVLAAACVPAHAAVLEVEVDRIDTPAAVLEQVMVRLDWPTDAVSGELRLSADSLALVDHALRLEAPRWHCTLERASGNGWRCAGTAAAKGRGEAELRLATGEERIDASMWRGKSRLTLAWPLEGGPVPIEATAIPADWLQPLLASAWPEAGFTGGSVGGTLQIDLSDADVVAVEGSVVIEDLGLDTSDGRIAAAGLRVDGTVAARILEDSQRIEATLRFDGGEVLVGAFYAALPPDASLAFTAEGGGARWTLSQLQWRDAQVLRVDGEAALDLDAEATLRMLALKLASDDLAVAGERYLGSVLGSIGLDGLALAGAVEATLAIADGDVRTARASVTGLDAVDARGRFALRGAEGALGWQRGADAETGTLRWREAALYELALGASTVHWHSVGGRLALREPAVVPLLGGRIVLGELAWHPAGDGGAPELSLAMSLAAIDLGALARAFEWPEFGGTLSGEIPSAHYEDGVLALEGGLSMRAFDGRVDIGALTIERPFGVAPTLTTDIELRLLDLVPLTGAFGFGEISGRLDGRISGLRLVDWQPVAFDAVLRTSTTAPDKRRISQRAVGDLSSVGGSGVAGGIQAQVLRVFDTFPYARIGLSCRLENDVCHMGGLAPRTGSSGAGYTIVEGSGLPRITVIGHQRQVDWPVLVARLEAATEGQAPIVD